MKKIFVVTMLCALAVTSATGYAQSTAKQLKAERKAMEARVKELSAEGWKSLQSDGLALLISEHNAKRRNNPDLYEISGTANQVKTTNLGKAKSRNNAINEYAEYCSGMLRARIVSDLHDVDEAQADNMVSGYERILSQKLEGEVRPSYYIYKEVGNGKYDVRGFFLIDENRLAKKQKEAIKEAADQANMAFDYGNNISDFINQNFNR